MELVVLSSKTKHILTKNVASHPQVKTFPFRTPRAEFANNTKIGQQEPFCHLLTS